MKPRKSIRVYYVREGQRWYFAQGYFTPVVSAASEHWASQYRAIARELTLPRNLKLKAEVL